jgi:predicted alpha/beta superfamily hydrolase
MGRVLTLLTRIPTLDREKTLHIYLPTGYGKKNDHFPVLYMHDGHNLFDLKTSAFGSIWNVHLALDKLQKKYEKNVIVVGIDCPSPLRFNEYSPWVNERIKEYKSYLPQNRAGGEGDLYVDWIVRVLKPWIDQKYRTNPQETFMAGSSMGGLISLYA